MSIKELEKQMNVEKYIEEFEEFEKGELSRENENVKEYQVKEFKRYTRVEWEALKKNKNI